VRVREAGGDPFAPLRAGSDSPYKCAIVQIRTTEVENFVNAIQVDGLVKSYGSNRAVDGISFSVEQGEIFGLLGPNGAGKTTTVEILEGLRDADAGAVELFGQDVRRSRDEVKQKIGVALQTTTLMQNLTAWELLDLFGGFYNHAVDPDPLLDRLGLTEKRNARVQTLSGGQQQRLSVALALVNAPQLVFLDEPTTGLDPQARRSLWDVVREMKSEGRTVLLTTHYMEEAELLCDRIAIMDHGKILAMDSPEGLVKSQFTERAIEFAKPEGATSADFADLPGVLRAADEGEDIVLYADQVQRTLGALLERAEERGMELDDVHIRRATLEDVFIKLTGRRIRE
jgi:ABC-2 type transport system ATP-binding protein